MVVPVAANNIDSGSVIQSKVKKGLLARTAAGLGGLLRSEAGVKGGFEKINGKKVPKETDLTKLAVKNLSSRNIYNNYESSKARLKGGVFDQNSAKSNYGMSSDSKVFYYGAGKSHYAASGGSLKRVGFQGRRFFGG